MQQGSIFNKCVQQVSLPKKAIFTNIGSTVTFWKPLKIDSDCQFFYRIKCWKVYIITFKNPVGISIPA